MVEFAGYSMPVSYSLGIIKEHLHTRSSVGLFDVSHMGQVFINGAQAQEFLERVLVADLGALQEGFGQLTLMLNHEGGIIDDCIVTKLSPNSFYLVVNAGRKDVDFKWMKEHASDFGDLELTMPEDCSLVAV